MDMMCDGHLDCDDMLTSITGKLLLIFLLSVVEPMIFSLKVTLSCS